MVAIAALLAQKSMAAGHRPDFSPYVSFSNEYTCAIIEEIGTKSIMIIILNITIIKGAARPVNCSWGGVDWCLSSCKK
jgi:hypothetical protein